MKVDHQFFVFARQSSHYLCQIRDKRQHQHAAYQLEQQAAERHPTAGGVLAAGIDDRQQATAEIGANHQTQRHFQRDHTGCGQGGGQQHCRQAGIADDGEQRAGKGIQHHVAGQRREQHFHTRRLGYGRRGGHDQLQRQYDQPEADAHAPHLANPGLLAAEEQENAYQNQQRRQPGKIEGQHPCHQGGADVGAQHDHQRRRQPHQPLRDERGDQQRGGVAALHQRGYADTGDERQRFFLDAVTQYPAQVSAVNPHNPGAHDVGTPH
ncbi:hypothetical protein D3C79_291740 [compost metagenome]